MAITHSTVRASGQRGFATDWNADHTIDDVDKPKNFTTLIVAASDSLDTSRADYVCDGVDDQVEINAALAALPVIGGRVSLLEGTYQISDSIQIVVDYTTLLGVGRATKIQSTGNFAVIRSVNHPDLTIEDLYIFGTGVGALNRGIYLTWAHRSKIEGCWIENCALAAIQLTTSTNMTINTNIIFGGAGSGIFIGTASTETSINGNIVTGMTGAITINDSAGSSCIGNIASSSTVLNGIMVNNSGNCEIVGNTCESNTANGIRIFNSLGCTVDGNQCNDNTVTGIIAANNSDNNVMVGNHCSGNNIGIEINNAGDVDNIVVGNFLKGNVAFNLRDLGTNTEAAHNQV